MRAALARLCPKQRGVSKGLEAAFSDRSCLRLSQATGSLGQSAAWAMLAGHVGPYFPRGARPEAEAEAEGRRLEAG